MAKQTITIDVPDGWEFDRLDYKVKPGEARLMPNCEAAVVNVAESIPHTAIILRRPQPKYIPFTVETFRPHRDRWVREKQFHIEYRVSRLDPTAYNSIFVGDVQYSFNELFDHHEFINADGSTEPCGQKVEG